MFFSTLFFKCLLQMLQTFVSFFNICLKEVPPHLPWPFSFFSVSAFFLFLHDAYFQTLIVMVRSESLQCCLVPQEGTQMAFFFWFSVFSLVYHIGLQDKFPNPLLKPDDTYTRATKIKFL